MIAFLAPCALYLAPSSSPAALTQWVPSLVVRGEYDDNVEFQASDAESDYALWASPGLAYRGATERWWLEGGAKVDVVRYRDATELNREDQLYRAAGAIDATERLELRADASYRESSTLESQLEETGRVTRRSGLYQVRGGAGTTYGLSVRSSLGLDYGYFRSAYASEFQADFDVHTVSLAWRRELDNERDRVAVRTGYQRFDSRLTEAEDVSLTVGWRHPVSEVWVLELAGGARHTRYDTRGEEHREWGGIFDLSSTWQGEVTTAELGGLADLTYGSEGVPVERERFRASLRRELSRRLWLGLGVDLARTRELDASEERRLYGSVAPAVGYRLGRLHTLSVAYRYGYNRDGARSGDEVATRNRVWVEWRMQGGRRR